MIKDKRLMVLALCAVLLAAGVVIMGAYTRLVHAGLGCPDWPTCYGHLWVPDSASEIEKANQSFGETPVEVDKTWPEQLHRLMASTLGVLILILFGLALKRLKAKRLALSLPLVALVGGVIARIVFGDGLDPFLCLLVACYFGNLFWLAKTDRAGQLSGPMVHVAVLAGLVVLQGFFGMWTVTLKLWPQVVTAHLLGGFATLALLWLLFLRLGGFSRSTVVSDWVVLRPWLLTAFILVVVQIMLGGWTSANYAALACADFPRCHNLWWPKADFIEGFNVFQHVGPNYLGGQLDNYARTGIHLTHRIGAILVTLSVGLLVWRLWLRGFRRLAMTVLASLCLQLTLGISNIVLSLPLAIAVAHNAGGAILLLCLLTCIYITRVSDTLD